MYLLDPVLFECTVLAKSIGKNTKKWMLKMYWIYVMIMRFYWVIWPVHLKPNQTSKVELFPKIVKAKSVKYFDKKNHFKCLTGF